ncbi:MAG: thymidine kinase [Flavobacteriales bacterium]
MFIEPSKRTHPSRGWVEVICGSMFSGKTEELIRRLRRAEFARMQVEIFKPLLDERYHKDHVVSHNETSIRSTPVASSEAILTLTENVDVVGVDEAQFFDERLPEVCNALANKGVRVIVAGLDMDFKGRPFGPMPKLMAMAEYVTKVHAICVECGELAWCSFRHEAGENLIVLGEKDKYVPLCRGCFTKMDLVRKK